MALKDIFGASSVAAIDAKLDELREKKARKQEEQTQIQEHLNSLQGELRKVNLEVQLEDSSAARKRLDELKSRIAKLEGQSREVGEEIVQNGEAAAELRQRREPALILQIESDFEEKRKTLMSVAREMDPLFDALRTKFARATEIAQELLKISALPDRRPSYLPPGCGRVLRDTFVATLRAKFEASEPYMQALGFDTAKRFVEGEGGSFSRALEKALQGEAIALKSILAASRDQSDHPKKGD